MVATAVSDKGQDSVPNMLEPHGGDERNEGCAELSGDENQGDELINTENEECSKEESQPGPSKRDDNEESDTANHSTEDPKAVTSCSESSDGFLAATECRENLLSADPTKENVDSAEDPKAVASCSKSSDGFLAATECRENLPSSDSNKENIDSNVLNQCVEYVPGDHTSNSEDRPRNYDNGEIPLPQLLKIHLKQLVSGFEYGEATKRRAQENMKTARDKNKNERKSLELGVAEVDNPLNDNNELVQPSTSAGIGETEHRTPHSLNRRVPECIERYPECKEVWLYMIFKEQASLKLRNPRLFNDFKSVTPRMRAILLDWLMEVASVYHLRRVTYYLSVDYFDRFLSIRPDIPKSLLQLVGITCLYIAAKVEEIYPPNLAEFSYVCDGACKASDMVSCELLILNSLGWEVVLATPTDWLNLYMQLQSKNEEVVRSGLNLDFNRDFIFPQYSAYQFTRASQLLDLMSLDPGFLKFGYSVVAAAAMYYVFGREVALAVSGLSPQQLRPCVGYMDVFFTIIKDTPDPRLQSCLGGPHPEEARMSSAVLQRMQNGPQNENYSFQTHVASMDYFEKATIFRLSRFTNQQEQAILKIVGENKAELVTEDAQATAGSSRQSSEDVPGEISTGAEENVDCSLIDDLNSLEELTKSVNENRDNVVTTDDSLMTLDEIFELILNQDDNKSTNSE